MAAVSVDGRVPPHDLDAEAAVLSAVMVDPAAMPAVAPILRPDFFYSESHRRIFEAGTKLLEAGKPIDIVQIASWLRDAGRLHQVGGKEYLTDILNAAPVVANVKAYAETVRERWSRRQMIVACQNISARGYIQPDNTTELLAELRRSVERIEACRSSEDPFPSYSAAELAEPLAPVPFLVEALRIAPGPPTLVAGYGYSRKTMALQDLALAVATGGDVWGTWRARRGRVRHIDFEQGKRLTQDRYQRLARARGFELGELAPADLALSCFPPLRLDKPEAEDALVRALDGFAVCIIDSLRAAAPSADENSSEVRAPLDMLSRVSERTGCVCIVVHHAKKPSKDEPDGAKFSIRGSSALFDACASVFIFKGTKNEATTVHHEKDRITGATLDDFGLDATDIPSGSNPRWALKVFHVDREAMGKPKSPSVGERFELVVGRVLEAIVIAPGCSKRYVRGLVGGSKDLIDEALDELQRRGKIVASPTGDRGSHAYRPT